MVGDGTWLTVREVVARLEGLVSEQTVRRLCDDGTLDTVRVGLRQDRRVKASSVDDYLARIKGGAVQAPVDDAEGMSGN